MSTPYKMTNIKFQGQGISHKLAWARVFLGFVCLWLILGNLIQGASSSYSEMLAKNAADDNLIASQQKAQNLKVNESIQPNQPNQTPVNIDPYNDQPASPLNIPIPAKPVSVLPAATSTGKAYIGGYRTIPNTAPKTGSMVTAAPPTATWNDNTTVLRGSSVIQLEYFKGQLLALTNDGTLWSSSDGISWNINYDPDANSFSYFYNSCGYTTINPFTIRPEINQFAVLGSAIYVTIGNAPLCLDQNSNVIRPPGKLDNGIYVSSDGGNNFGQIFESKGGQFSECDTFYTACPTQAGVSGITIGGGAVYFHSDQNGVSGSNRLFALGVTDPIYQASTILGVGGAVIIPLGKTSAFSNAYIRINGGLYRASGVNLTNLNVGNNSEGIYTVAEGSDGTLWSVDGGLSKSIDGGSSWMSVAPFDGPITGDPVGGLESIAIGLDGKIWLGTQSAHGIISCTEGNPTDNFITCVNQQGNLSSVNMQGMHTLVVLPGQVPDSGPSPVSPLSVNGNCDCGTGEPINPVTGNFYENFTDLTYPTTVGAYINLDLTRSYNSQEPISGFFGKGWSSTYEMNLVENTTSGVITITNADGRRDPYTPNGSGGYNSPQRANSTLVKGTGIYTLTNVAQVRYTFNSTGQLTQIKDRNNNQISINTTNGIVSDNYGRVFTPTFTTNNRVASVTDGRRTVKYGYDSTFTYLQIMTDTRGFKTRYEYDANGLLTRIFDQNDNKVVQNTYDMQSRVITQNTYPDLTTTYTLTISYDPTNNLSVVTNTRVYSSTYYYNANSLLINQVNEPLGVVRFVNRNNNGDITNAISPNSSAVQATYNNFGKPTSYSTAVYSQGSVQNINTIVSYNSFNDPLVVTDTRGNTTSYSYTSAGNIQIMTDTLGQATRYNYDSQGRVISMTTVGGLNVAYSYISTGNGVGQVGSITRTVANTLVGSSTTPVTKTYRTNYTYTPEGWLASETDSYDTASPPNPIPTITYGYNPAGQLVTTTNQLGQIALNEYDVKGNLITTTNSLGQKTRYGYDQLNRLITTTQVQLNLTTTQNYDEAGNVITQTDPRLVKTYFNYDALNRLITTTVPLQGGASSSIRVNAYDAAGNLTRLTLPNNCGGCSNDQVTRYQYDGLNRLVTTTLGYGVFNYQQGSVYDPAGNIVQNLQSIVANPAAADWTNPAKVVTSTTAYDAMNRPISRVTYAYNPLTAVNQPLVTSYSYNDPQNRRTVIDSYGITTTSQSDSAGRAISTTTTPISPTLGALTQQSYNFYDARDLAIRSIDPAGNWSDTGYDLLQRVMTATQYTGVGGTGTVLTNLTYYTDTVKSQVTRIGPAPHYERQDMFMDEAGRVVSGTIYSGPAVTYPTIPTGALTTRFAYDGQNNQTIVTNTKGYATNYTYENTGWLNSVVQTATLQPGQAPVNLTTTYGYDLQGHVITTADARNPTGTPSLLGYDVLFRKTGERDQLGNLWQWSYDGLSRLAIYTDTKSQATNYTYDNASHLAQVVSQNAGSGLINTTYSLNSLGQVTRMQDNPGSNTDYTYDGLNRVITVNAPAVGKVQYGYDVLGRRNSLLFNYSGITRTAQYGYDALSRPVTMSNWAGQVLSYSYSGARLNQQIYPNGITATYGFDGASRLTSINQVKAGTTVFSTTYTLDQLGNRTAISENLNGQSRTQGYNYDELSQLITETTQVGSTTPITSAYTYDQVGNRTRMVSYSPPISKTSGPVVITTTSSYDVANRLTGRSQQGTGLNLFNYSYIYDNNGSLTSETNTVSGGEVTSYTYDTRNRLTGWQRAKGGTVLSSAGLQYDGNNTRRSITYQGQTTWYLQDTQAGSPVVLMERVGTNLDSFLYPLGSTTPVYETNPQGSNLWYHSDGLGSVRLLTNDSGTTQNSYAYSAFGANNGGTTGSKFTTTHQFAGEQLDPTGLYFNRARYYSPSLGSFISRDTFGGYNNRPQTLNRYVYTQNNPVLWTDPSGFDGTPTTPTPPPTTPAPPPTANPNPPMPQPVPAIPTPPLPLEPCSKDCKNCRIEIRIARFAHTFTLYTDSDGNKTVYEGDGKFDQGPPIFFILPVTSWQLVLDAYPRPYEPKDAFAPMGASSGYKVLLTGREACTKKQCLEREIQVIKSWQLLYIIGIFGFNYMQNSNSVTHTLLRRCSIPEDKPFEWFAPGWDTILSENSIKYHGKR